CERRGRAEEVLAVALRVRARGLRFAVGERLVDLARQGIEPGGIVEPHPDRAEEVEGPARGLHRLFEVLALEPEMRRALVRNRADDLAREVDGEKGPMQGPLDADRPSKVLHRTA